MNTNNILRTIVLVLAVFVLGFVLLGIGFFVGRMFFPQNAFAGGWMMGNSAQSGWQMPYGMMRGEFPGQSGSGAEGFYGPGMMEGGMMGGNTVSGLVPDEPLSIEKAEAAVEDFLNQISDPNLEVAEIMIFDNHAYVEISERDTGIGAMEVLVDPVSLAVYPEPGPNMMWNLKYGMMSGYGSSGMMGGMMGSGFYGSPTPRPVEAEMPLTEKEALQIAQDYLDEDLPAAQVGQEAEPFYGYYTIHVERAGQVVGMLGVNGYNGQVFPHTWHGQFVEMSAEDH